jgi:hypothetical protein
MKGASGSTDESLIFPHTTQRETSTGRSWPISSSALASPFHFHRHYALFFHKNVGRTMSLIYSKSVLATYSQHSHHARRDHRRDFALEWLCAALECGAACVCATVIAVVAVLERRDKAALCNRACFRRVGNPLARRGRQIAYYGLS